ncbi:MAG: hypothetical protein GF346_13020, partial [Candidatus Eisenbacteria bacterium]|nr:hypothetical protein [Candidatus Latescibacterota bacterium]MBD3303360.1 hypothetical protein [Candidatus Eisenbacteria bacterium]
MRSPRDPRTRNRFPATVAAKGIAALALAALLMAVAPRTDPPRPQGTGSTFPARSGVSQVPGDGLAPKAPNPWFFVERAYPLGAIPRARWEAAQLQARAMREEAGARSGSWIARGPTNIGGRLTDIAVDPRDADVVYAAAAEGGVLRSRDAGQTWDPLFDEQASLSVGAVALDPNDPDVVYAGTGEVNPGGGSVAYGGVGVFRSRDQGDSWEPIGLENSGSIGRIRVDPGDPDRIFVAVMGPLWETSPERGVYRTTDGGASWDRVLFVSDSTGCVDLVQRPDDPDVLFAAMWERIRRPEAYRYGGITCGVYRTDDGGDTWSLVGGGLPGPSNDLGRIGLSLCASQPDVLHAIYADRIGYFDGLYRSTDGGASWSRTSDAALSGVFSSYGWWFGNVRTHPIDPQMIYVLGLPFYRSTNGGASYHNASGIMHVDHHGLEFGPGPDPVLYNGNDGGVYRSTNGGSVWTKCPDLPITQIYRVGLDANDPDALYLGAQDNGTCRTLTGGLDDWSNIFGGDGFQPLVHPLSSSRIWVQYQYGNVYYSSNGGNGWSSAGGGIGSDRVNWNAPHVQDPTDPDRRYFGTHRLYRSTSNTSWTAISPDLTGGPHGGNSGQVNGTLTTVRVSPLDGQVVWTGSDDGRVHVTTDGGTSWTDVSAALPDRWITSVRTDPFARETAYVTISGFRWAEPLPRIHRTTDLGATWTEISGNLPDAPVNDLIVDPTLPGRLFAATDVGVFQSVDGGGRWGTLGTNLPNVVVNALALDPVERILYAGTYGRSFFAYALEDAAAVDEPIAAPLSSGPEFRLYPNPASQSVWISWDRAERCEVAVHSVSGRRVARISGFAPADGRIRWDGRDPAGRPLPAGAYFV